MTPPSFRCSPATLDALELPALLAVVAEMAVTDLGRRRLLAAAPFDDFEALYAHQRRWEEVRRLLVDGSLVQPLEIELSGVLERLARAPRELSGREVLELGALLENAAAAVGRIRGAADEFPELAAAVREVPDGRPLLGRIRRTFDPRGEVRDDATPRLAELKSRVRRQREELYRHLQSVVGEHREELSEETVPMREGRLVLVLQAGARGRIPGLVHGKSASGKSFYFEPLTAVEGNNRLQESREEEESERQRIVLELLEALAAEQEVVAAHAELVARLDALQATCRFAERCGGRLAEVAEAWELRLVAGRHPLLDPRLAALREAALGQPGHTAEVVPLDLDLTPERRGLVVTGPNAGGKTVALKTAGLLTLAAQCGLPVPVARGTRLPLVRGLVATVGDEQDLLADRSTFSGRLLRLREAWELAGPDSLILLDELGSGTDPEEGAALAGALFEELVARGSLVMVTTHLVPLAAQALELPGAGCAAMELDRDTGDPLFRLRPGPPGGSEAIALARRMGLDPELLDRAEARLSGEARQLRRLLAEVEQLRRELREERQRLEEARQAAEDERRELAAAGDRQEAEHRSEIESLQQAVESFRDEVRRRLGDEVRRLEESVAEGRRRGLARKATERLFAAAPELPEVGGEPLPLEVGARVRHRQLGWEGRLETLERGRAVVEARGKRLRCQAEELEAVPGEVGPRPSPEGTSRRPEAPEVPAELHLIGERVEPALARLEGYLDDALLADRRQVRIVHGHGSGRLRDAVRERLAGHPAVAHFRPGERGEGGDGATVVTLSGS